jgi:hypothetical protein
MGLNTVQFTGKQQVMKAFEKTDVINWSYWQGKQMLFAYEGDDPAESSSELQEWLGLMSKSTNATYTLKFYRDHRTDAEILPSTRESSSFNFRLYEPEQENYGRPGTVGATFGNNDAVLAEIQKLTGEINAIKTKVNGVPAEEPLQWWERLLDTPFAAPLIGKLFNIDMSGVNSGGAAAGAKMAGVPGTYDIDAILDALEAADPKFEEHMWKLQQLHIKDPGKFKMILGILDQMNF